MTLTGPSLLAFGEALAGLCRATTAINHRRYNNQINQTWCSGAKYQASQGSPNHVSESRFNPFTQAWLCVLVHASIRSEWSREGSGSASSMTSSICGATVHNSRHLLSFIQWSLSPPRLFPASWTSVGVTAALSSSSDLNQIKTTVQWNDRFIKPVWIDSFTNLTFIQNNNLNLI